MINKIIDFLVNVKHSNSQSNYKVLTSFQKIMAIKKYNEKMIIMTTFIGKSMLNWKIDSVLTKFPIVLLIFQHHDSSILICGFLPSN